ncbi:T9SS type A sorting domain-containing protein [Mesonia sp. HuA40]|uniref:T9SS type A sorting domain-containing protein n=1 Tax=Mesonia sp. HuA40 TaxID=2602761 RepID=UPI0011CB9ADC|nr:T9SS type A sorting domain-containing protein [Mesonia sp. HuA40]TXK71751.1 T9SS type A sorting domain-containing protein [Mesonia sp. HuA40]
MKKTLLSLFCLASASLFAQNVHIPDPDLKNVLISNTGINTNGDGEISFAEAQAFTGVISAPNLNIQDLTGLEAFTNITEVFLANNNISFANFTANTALTKISIAFNPLTTLDVTGLTNLITLGADYTQSLASIDLSTNVNLEALSLNNNQLTSLDVSNNSNLVYLSAGLNQLTTIDLSNNPAIEMLNLHINNLSSLDLSNQTNLTVFAIYSNNLTASSLTLPNTSIVTIAYLSDNPLGSIDVSSFTNLEKLKVNNTNLSTIDLSSNTVLEELEANTNNFTSIDLSSLAQLTSLKLVENDLTSIDLSNNPVLSQLYIGDNDLTSLDVTNNPNIYHLELQDNLFSSIDVSMLPSLNTLYVSDNANLQIINMANANNTSIYQFNATNCPNLSCVQLDNGFTPPATQWIMDQDPNTIYSYTTCTLGIEQNILDTISIYPNPSAGSVNLNGIDQVDEISVFSMAGKKVHTTKELKMNLNHLSAGVYFIQVKANQQNKTFKFIKN